MKHAGFAHLKIPLKGSNDDGGKFVYSLYEVNKKENSAQLELMFGLVELEYGLGVGGSGNPNFFLHIVSS